MHQARSVHVLDGQQHLAPQLTHRILGDCVFLDNVAELSALNVLENQMHAVGKHDLVVQAVDVRMVECLEHLDLSRRVLHSSRLVLLLSQGLDGDLGLC